MTLKLINSSQDETINIIIIDFTEAHRQQLLMQASNGNTEFGAKRRLDLLSHCGESCWCSVHERVPPAGLPVQCGRPAAQPATGPSEPGSSPSPSSGWTAALHTQSHTRPH